MAEEESLTSGPSPNSVFEFYVIQPAETLMGASAVTIPYWKLRTGSNTI